MRKLLIAVIIFFIVILSTWILVTHRANTKTENNFLSCLSQFPHLDPRLDCSTIDQNIEQVQGLKENISYLVNQQKQLGNANEVGVFFRDLNSNRWFGINENVNFYPASLAKLPFTMMMYKYAEVDKPILDDPVQIDDSDLKLNDEQNYQPPQKLSPGSYSVQELLRRMLVYSDNAPTEKLMNISSPLNNQILSDLGVLFPPDAQTGVAQWNITAKIYANFFRILYNASYLRPEYSNTILDQLSQSTFRNALVAGIPENIEVAHKFGEMSQIDPATNQTVTVLNDCGIIYKQNNPYILCVMTRGTDFTKLEQTIKIISADVYKSSLD